LRRAALPLTAVLLAALTAAPAHASRAPTGAEARAIKKAFLAGIEEQTKVKKIRVSTADPSFASVSYTVTIGETRSAGKTYTAPVPAIVIERKGKWKPVPKPPKKVPKDLKPKDPRSAIQVSGEHTASLTRSASCTDSGGSYGAGVYDPGTDTYLDVQFHGDYYRGYGQYPALGVGSVAGLYGNSGTMLVYETGQGNDAFTKSGDIYAYQGWGIIEATMARVPDEGGTYPQSVLVSGSWACR
jgi:hypothetical protein